MGSRFSTPVQTGPEAHPASCTMDTGSFPGVRCGRGVTLTPHPLLVQRSKIEYSYTPTLPKGLVACERVKATYLNFAFGELRILSKHALGCNAHVFLLTLFMLPIRCSPLLIFRPGSRLSSLGSCFFSVPPDKHRNDIFTLLGR